MKGSQVGIGFCGGNDTALVGFRSVGAQYAPALFLEGGNQRVAFAKQFGGDAIHAEFEDQFKGGVEADEPEHIVAAHFVALGTGSEGDFLAGHEIGAADIVPPVDHGAEGFVPGFADVEKAGAAGAEQPFVGVGGDEVRMFGSGRKGSNGLDAVDAQGDPTGTECGTQCGQVETPTGDEMAGGESHQSRVFIHLTEDVGGRDAAQFAGGKQSDFDAALRESHPGIDVGRIVVEVDDDVVAAIQREACGNIGQCEGGGADEGDFVGLRADQAGDAFAGLRVEVGSDGEFLVVMGGLVGVPDNGVSDPFGEWANGGVGEEGAMSADGEFLEAEVGILEEIGEAHQELDFVQDLAVEAEPEADDLVGDDQEDTAVDHADEDAGRDAHEAETFLLVMGDEAGQGVIDLAGDFGGGVDVGKVGWEEGIAEDQFRCGFTVGDTRGPAVDDALESRGTAGIGGEGPGVHGVDAGGEEGVQSETEAGQGQGFSGTAENRDQGGQRFEQSAGGAGLGALEEEDEGGGSEVDGAEEGEFLEEECADGAVSDDADEVFDRQDEECDVEDENGVGEAHQDLPGEGGSGGVGLGEGDAGSIEASGAFAGFDQGEVKRRNPGPERAERLAGGRAVFQAIGEKGCASCEATGWGVLSEDTESFHQGQPCGDRGGNLVIEIGPGG